MAEQRPLIERVLDVVVYAPIGLLGQLQQEVPKFAAEGREKFGNRVQVAKFIGQMSVTYGRQELARRVAERRASSESAAQARVASPDVPSSVAVVPSVTVVVPVPFEGYDTMAASHIVQQMRTMTSREVAAVAAYEASHRNRRTVLAKVDQMRNG